MKQGRPKSLDYDLDRQVARRFERDFHAWSARKNVLETSVGHAVAEEASHASSAEVYRLVEELAALSPKRSKASKLKARLVRLTDSVELEHSVIDNVVSFGVQS